MITDLRKEIIIFLGTLVVFTSGVFWILNGGAYAQVIKYWVVTHVPLPDEDVSGKALLEVAPRETAVEEKDGKNYSLSIPKISVETPIILPADSSNASVLASLEEGVGLYPESAPPGKPGRAVILGHSSRASWYRGGYATIFSLLPKLEKNDTFTIAHGGKKYRYAVTERHIMTPEQTNNFLTKPTGDISEVVLITCYPIGSASKRTLVIGKLNSTD